MLDFLKPKPKTIYYDPLEEWRKIKMGDYNLFDKVIITSIASYRREYIGKEGVIIGYNQEDIEKGNLGYVIIMSDGKRFFNFEKNIKFKKSYGEFQEEFEAMNEVEKKTKELQELERQLKEKAGELQEYHKKARKIVEGNIKDIYHKIK